MSIDALVLDHGELVLGPRPVSTFLADIGFVATERPTRPRLRSCVDWTEQRAHIAGQLGADLLHGLLDRAWLERRPRDRSVNVTALGKELFVEHFNVHL